MVKGHLTGWGLHGCTCFPPTGHSNICSCLVLLIKDFCSCLKSFQVLFCFLVLAYHSEQWRRSGDYIKCEQMVEALSRHLNTFSNLFIVGRTLHTYQHNLGRVLLLTVPMYTMLSKLSEYTISCCYCC